MAASEIKILDEGFRKDGRRARTKPAERPGRNGEATEGEEEEEEEEQQVAGIISVETRRTAKEAPIRSTTPDLVGKFQSKTQRQ